MFIFRFFMIVNWVVVKRLGIAGMVFFICLGKKCDFVLYKGFCLLLS